MARRQQTLSVDIHVELDMQSIQEAQQQYAHFGFDTLPLRPGTKWAILRGWQYLTPDEMWKRINIDVNIGLRAGGKSKLAIIDCDEIKKQGTFQNFQYWMDGLGYKLGDYPVVQTASGDGRHIYVSLIGNIIGNISKLSEEFGAGEFRYGPGAYVVAPPSIVNQSIYSLLIGDYRQLPRLAVKDIIPILRNQDSTQEIGKKTRRIPRLALALLKGQTWDKYHSRSEAEYALILSLINAGYSFENVLNLFYTYPAAGKFKDLYSINPKRAITWLRRTYDEASRWGATHESKARQIVQALISKAQSTPWPGRTGLCDRAIYIAHCDIAYRAGQLKYYASTRQLANLAGTSSMTAADATRRLCRDGLLVLEIPATADLANIYRLVPNLDTSSQ
jgi:hypothetical protein